MNSKYSSIFYLELGILISRDLPLDYAIQTLSPHFSRSFQSVLKQIVQDLQKGAAFSHALKQHSRCFDHFSIQMIEMGEHSGTLPAILKLLAEWSLQDHAIKTQCKHALFYPLLNLGFAILSLILFIKIMLPHLIELYAQFHQALPSSTQRLINISRWLEHYAFLCLLCSFGASACFYFLSQFFLKIKKFFHFCIYHCPIWHTFKTLRFSYQFSIQLELLLAQDTPLNTALMLIQGNQSNLILQEKIKLAADLIQTGSSLSEALTLARCLPTVFLSYIKTGEQTGQLKNMLHCAELFYAEEFQSKIKKIIECITPFSLILLSLLVGSMAYCFYQPLLSIQMF